MGRSRTTFRLLLDDVALEEIERQAALAGLRRSPYMERVIYLAHQYQSPFVPEMATPLPLKVDVRELQDRTRLDVDAAELEPPSVGGRFVVVRVDDPLGERIYDWCDDHDVTYAGYMRSILRLAAGYQSAEDLKPEHVQGDLLGTLYRGERARAS